METTSRAIEYVPLDKVVPTGRNPKEHDLAAIVKSIAKFGLTSQMVRDERTGELVIGNGRRHALYAIRKHLAGEKTPEVDDDTWREADRYLGGEPPGGVTVTDGQWIVPVVAGWASRDDEHAAAVVVTDNRLTEKGGWDERLLTEILDEIADVDPDLLTITGYDVDDLDDLLSVHGEEKITLPVGETGARWAETDDEFAERAAVTGNYADRKPSGAMTEMILLMTVDDYNEANTLIDRIHEKTPGLTNAQAVLHALRSHADA